MHVCVQDSSLVEDEDVAAERKRVLRGETPADALVVCRNLSKVFTNWWSYQIDVSVCLLFSSSCDSFSFPAPNR
jgi:hypothetical protein